MSSYTPIGFHVREDGCLYCDDVRVEDLHRQLVTSETGQLTSPVFVYSRRQVEANVRGFFEAFKLLPVPARLNFSMKSNHNFHILQLLQSLGCGVTLVSGIEQRFAMEAGFEPQVMLLNGSGKSPWEISAAVNADVLLNVDSEFDLQNILEACGKGNKTSRVLLRLNLDIDPKVHTYVSTGKAGSKFGLDTPALSRVVRTLTSPPCPVLVEGLHCHLGSTIKEISVFRESVKQLLAIRQNLKVQGLADLRLVNVGGGLTIDYTRYEAETHPFRQDDQDTQREVILLRDHFLRQRDGTAETEETSGLLHTAVQCLESYSKEKTSQAAMQSSLQKVLEQLGILEEIKHAFPLVLPQKSSIPSPADLVRSLADVFETPRDDDVTLLFEPGRALVGNAGVLLSTVLGCKSTGDTRFLVVDGAMTEVIRPSLYGAYHHVSLAAPTAHAHAEVGKSVETAVVDVVGPVCESADFLGKNRLLPLPAKGTCAVVHDVGAYCSSMASNYNLRSSGVGVLDECLRAYEEVKMGHRWLYIIFKVSDDLRICVEERGGHDKTYDDFVEKLKAAARLKQCRYAIFDVRFMQNGMPQEKIAFFLWSPDCASIRQKMLYASSKQALRNNMRGIQAEIQCTDDTDLAMSNVLERLMSKYT